jgi:hypothetical protein
MARKKKTDDLVSKQDLIEELDKLTLEYEKMATAKRKTVSTISDKLIKVNESFTVYMYDNGYMIEVSGRDSENDYKTVKIMVSNLEQLVALVQEATEMDRDD